MGLLWLVSVVFQQLWAYLERPGVLPPASVLLSMDRRVQSSLSRVPTRCRTRNNLRLGLNRNVLKTKRKEELSMISSSFLLKAFWGQAEGTLQALLQCCRRLLWTDED